MPPAQTLPRLPRPVALLARPLPLLPLSRLLGALVRRMSRDNPALLRRLGAYRGRRYLIDPADLPFVLLLDTGLPGIAAHRRDRPPAHDARITGLLSAFLAMMHGSEDGDALFFSRDLMIEGDTEAVLALRNAIDDAELDLAATLGQVSGPLAPLMARAIARAEQVSGVTLHRIESTGDWR